MKKAKRLLVLFITAIICSLLQTGCTFENCVSDSGTCGDNLQWTLDYETGVLEISGTGDMYFGGYSPCRNRAQVIKSVIICEGVTSICPYAFFMCINLSSITIPNSVTSIGDCAFSSCDNLTSITIPNSVTSIGDYAFSSCDNLTSITIPNSVTSIGDYAFSGCTGLTSVHISDIAAWCNISFSDKSANPLYYAKHLYVNNLEITELVIPNSITSIGNYTFSGCSGLTRVTIPNSVTSIGDDAFFGCSNLTSISIPNSVISIGNNAFYGCISLPIVDNVRYADTYLVAAVNKFQSSYIIKDGTKWIGNSAFNGTSLISITIPNSVTSIGSRAFFDCSNLTSISIPNSVTSIRDSAFCKCINLTSITIPNSVISIGNDAFRGCNSMSFITIPEGVTSIGDDAFFGCSNLTSISIPNSVISIGNDAFYNCIRLTRITNYAIAPQPISDDCFYSYREIFTTCKLYVPAGSVNLYKTTRGWKEFKNILSISE